MSAIVTEGWRKPSKPALASAPEAAGWRDVQGRLLRLRCPLCGYSIGTLGASGASTELKCSSCGFVLRCEEGIWRALAPARAERFQQFICEYQRVRSQEGRRSSSADYFLELPYRDLTRRNVWQWKIRSRSFRCFERKVLSELERRYRRGLDVLDVGAGNCWMSYRLALRGHHPVAIDLLVNDWDGLGAARHYFNFLPQVCPRFQAEMDRLPFADGQFDIAIYNASLHYSEDYEKTLREVWRCLRRPAHVLVLDSPFYYRDESGRRMVEERHIEFERQYGFRSDSIPSQEYLTAPVLDLLARADGCTWKVLKPWYGLGWAVRPWKAKLLARREPSKFFILWATRETS
jgi:SAM-dependent methyltransferase/ribosomal protein S27E